MSELTRVYFGHHKCASQYIKSIMVQSARLMGWSTQVDRFPFVLPMDYHLHEPFVTVLHRKREMLGSDESDLVCLENADNAAVAILSRNREYRGFHVIREPRDIVVSGYFSHRYSHLVSEKDSPWLWEHRCRLRTLADIEQGLLAEIEYCGTYFERLQQWDYENPHVLELRYEDLVAQPHASFIHIFRFLDVKTPALAPISTGVMISEFLLNRWFGLSVHQRFHLPQPLLQTVLRRNTFRRRSGGRRPGDENIQHHYRKGVSGDWQNYFTPRVKDAFKACYSNLLVSLGYEQDEEW